MSEDAPLAGARHPLASDHLPGFMPGADGSDPLFTVVVVLVLVIVLVVGNLYLRLHALPERMAHRANSAQFQVVAVLALIALFTHNNYFWIAALLLAAVRLPDLSTPLERISGTLDRLAGRQDQTGGSKDA